MIAYTLQVNNPSAYIPYKVERHKDNTFGHSTLQGMKADLPSDTLQGGEKGMGHTAQAIMLSLSVPNVSYTAHLLSEL